MTLSIRPAQAEDAAALLSIYAPYVEETAISFEAEPPSLEEFRARMGPLPWLVARREGLALGYAYAAKHRERAAYAWSVEVSVYVARDHHRQGIGRALYTELLGVLRELGYCNAYAGITLPNPASVKLHESLGFEPVGVFKRVGYKMGQWRDVGWWQLQLACPDVPITPAIGSSPASRSSSSDGDRPPPCGSGG